MSFNSSAQVSGQQLTWFFTQWLDSTGAPEFKNKYTVYRTQKGFRVVGEISRHSSGLCEGWWNLLVVFFSELDAALNFTDRGQVFIDLALVGTAQPAGEAAGVVEDIIQDAGFIALALPAVRGIFVE